MLNIFFFHAFSNLLFYNLYFLFNLNTFFMIHLTSSLIFFMILCTPWFLILIIQQNIFLFLLIALGNFFLIIFLSLFQEKRFFTFIFILRWDKLFSWYVRLNILQDILSIYVSRFDYTSIDVLDLIYLWKFIDISMWMVIHKTNLADFHSRYFLSDCSILRAD